MAIDYKTGVTAAVKNVLTFVPKLLVFLLILIIGFFVAKAIGKVLTKVLQRVGFDDLVERGGVKKALEKSQYEAASILSKVVYYAIMLFVLSTAFAVFGQNPISDYLHAVIAYLPLVFVAAIVIIVIGAAVAAAAQALIQNSLGGLSYGFMLANIASTVIIALFAIAALNQLHIAQNVANALLYAILAAAVGVVVVAVGGGISTMSSRWQNVADKYDAEKDNVREQIRNAPSVRQQAQQAKGKAQSAVGSDRNPPPGARPY